MGMFANLMGKIFAHAATPVAPAVTATPAAPAPAPVGSAPADAATPPAAAPTTPASAPAPAAAAPASAVDVAAILDALAAKNPEHLDWKKSIVDLLKLVGMDSSLSARKELAHDLSFSGDESDSAGMNVWLHKEVLKQLAANGGKVPADLLG